MSSKCVLRVSQTGRVRASACMRAGAHDARCNIKADASPVKLGPALQPWDPPGSKCPAAWPARARAAAPAEAAPVYPEGCLIRRLLEARAAGVPFAAPPRSLCCPEAALVTQAGPLPLSNQPVPGMRSAAIRQLASEALALPCSWASAVITLL